MIPSSVVQDRLERSIGFHIIIQFDYGPYVHWFVWALDRQDVMSNIQPWIIKNHRLRSLD